ncbi:MAG: SGNH/GDSL hydrolase family protein, partial [Gammaproteobacteria bacterium]|nr:SGNH/GDSL hydrolase family protein [Gammaproteobacteria bacterium]
MSKTPTKTPTSPGRRRVFMLVALVIPVLFFVLVEGVLRLAGAGDEFPLFIPHPQQSDYLLANPQVLTRFFGDLKKTPSMKIETVYFKAKKPAKGLRIVVQGGSSAAGFPYGFGGSLTGMLEQRLRRSYPDREIEVVNTAMSAVNSYALLAFADEIIAQHPDAVLVYAGHNEYLGILGVGSNFL